MWQRPDFATFEVSLLNNFMMMFGNFPEDWAGMEFATPLRLELIVYVVLYFLVVFLLMQNFLLAIVVEAYMAVAEENQQMETEQDFVSDLAACFRARVMAIQYGWPNFNILGKTLTGMTSALRMTLSCSRAPVFPVLSWPRAPVEPPWRSRVHLRFCARAREE